MHQFIFRSASILLLLTAARPAAAQPTYCNPLNLDYAFKPSRHTYYGTTESHRSTADAAVVNYKGDLYLFSTNQQGYWWTPDLLHWHFVRKSFKINRSNDDVCAPGAWAWGDTLLFMPSHMDRDNIPLYMSTDPKGGAWTQLLDSFPQAHAWDPSFFKDDDGKAYLYWGASNFYPLYVRELDPALRYAPKGETRELIRLHPDRHGWERFGENNADTTINPYMEGVWMTKHRNKYYLQYAAPGTEFNIYADGVYTSEHPTGPFEYQTHNPVSLKPGGFITGAGHGSTFQDRHGNYWHIGTVMNWIKYKFERRLAVWPAGFDRDGILYSNTAFGDYPHYLPVGARDHAKSSFTGWMMLSYNKKVQVSSALPQYPAAHAVDEHIRTYWSAASAAPGEFLSVDLGKTCTVRAVQINYADEDVHIYDKRDDIYHQYRVWQSRDGKNWKLLLDKSTNKTDVPHDYVALDKPVQTRFLKLENVHMAAGKFALAGFRVFGNAPGPKPAAPKSFKAIRNADTRDADFSWSAVPGAYAYQIYYGIAPDKLYHCIAVHDKNTYHFRGLDKGTRYYAAVEALGMSGVSARSAAIEVR
jgi:xylan 1,4-beta-xylosidase